MNFTILKILEIEYTFFDAIFASNISDGLDNKHMKTNHSLCYHSNYNS
jgi:hypothetical protein